MILSIILILIIIGALLFAAHTFVIQRSWRQCAESGNFTTVKNEPFPGALCLSAIVQSCIGESYYAARIMESVFGRRFDEWNSMTKSVSDAKGLNRDLLIENLISIIKKQNDDFKLKYIPLIFKTLTAAEFMWNEKTQGARPTEYLKNLLNYSVKTDDKTDAYRILGLEPGASEEKIRKAHRRLAARYHPDRNTETGKLDMFLKIQTAYELLTD
ncbi:MAG: J domain-containing protein [Treponema sp.]|nr:J domain-containing protein [Treponema sp.]